MESGELGIVVLVNRKQLKNCDGFTKKYYIRIK